MNVHEILGELGHYFKEKILAGDYELVSAGNATATIRIDQEFEFQLWIANRPECDFDVYFVEPLESKGVNFVLMGKYMKFKTQKERLKGWRQLQPFLEGKRQQEKLKTKQRLLKELEELENGKK